MHPTLNHKILEGVPNPSYSGHQPLARILRTFPTRPTVEPIFLSTVAPTYKEMKLACSLLPSVCHLVSSFSPLSLSSSLLYFSFPRNEFSFPRVTIVCTRRCSLFRRPTNPSFPLRLFFLSKSVFTRFPLLVSLSNYCLYALDKNFDETIGALINGDFDSIENI